MNNLTISNKNITFVRDLPKVELHLHLEGAIPLYSLLQLIEKYHHKNFITLKELEDKFKYTDFSHFIKTWYWKNQFIKEYDDFELISEHVALDLATQNIRYTQTLDEMATKKGICYKETDLYPLFKQGDHVSCLN